MDGAERHHKDKAEGSKAMTAKQYLSQVHAIRRQIEALEEQIEFMTTKAAGVKGITYDVDRVDASPENTLEATVIELAEITNRFNRRVLKYSRLVLKITEQINGMDNADHVELLTLRYLQTDKRGKRMTLDRIARKMNRSPDRIWHMHGEALAAFEKKYLQG